MSYIARSISTGRYHLTNDPNITFCNHSGQRRSARNRKATDDEVSKASADSFCRKCFPYGKPEVAA